MRPEALVRTYAVVVLAVAKGLQDKDAEVRRLSAGALHQAAQALVDEVPLSQGEEFPPPGRPLTPEERQAIDRQRQAVKREAQTLAPLVRSLGVQMFVLTKALEDPEADVSVSAAQTVETLARARQRLLRRALSGPELGDDTNARKPDDPLGEALRDAVPGLAKALARPAARLRVAAVHALEALEQDAAKATAALVVALGDENPFVRWGAIRTLAKVPPLKAVGDVARLGKLLKDPNEDVRMTAVALLERYGPHARPAVPALCDAARQAEPALRVLVIRALAAGGAEAQPQALPVLREALTAPDAGVREAAAVGLGKLGPADEDTAKALRRSLKDSSPEVRLAASEALLR